MTTSKVSRIGRQIRDQIPPPLKVSSLRETWWLIKAHPEGLTLLRVWAIVFVAVALMFLGAPYAARQIKGWQARRLAREASALMEARNWTAADRKVRDALSLRSTEPEVWVAIARLLSRTGQSDEAIEWWRNIANSRPLALEDRRDYAAAALATNDLEIAAEQINILLAQEPAPSPSDFLLAGRLATMRGNSNSALRSADKVLEHPLATTRDILGAAAVVFLNTPADSASHISLCDRLVVLARNSDDAALDALTLLARQPLASGPATVFLAFSTPSSDLCSDGITLSEIAERLEKHERARGYHRLLALDLRAQLEPWRTDEFVGQAVSSFGHGDDETLTALGAWLYSRGRFEAELKIVSADRANRRRELFVERVRALASLGRIAEAEELLLSDQSIIDPAFEHMYLAVMRSRAGEAVASTNEWSRALESAENTQQLLILAEFAENNGAPEIADAAYDRAVIKQPTLRSAYLAHLKLAELMGRTVKAHDIALKITQHWPEDTTSQMHELYLRLLLNPSRSELQAAEERAKTFTDYNPWHIGARMVLSLARLKLGKQADALEAISTQAGAHSTNAPPMAVHAAALAANGWTQEAREEAQKLLTVQLLPEERALIAPLLSRTN